MWGRYAAERIIALTFCQLASRMAWERLPLAAKVLGRLLWLSMPRRRALAIDNLRQAFRLSLQDATCMAGEVFTHIALTALEFLCLGVRPCEVLAKVQVEGLEGVKEAWERTGRLILVTGHLGNFELMGARLAQEFPLWVIARPQSPAMWGLIKGIREKVGMRVLDKIGSLKDALKVLRNGGVLGLLADQHAGEGQGSLLLPFMGRLASVFKTPALLAARTQSPLVFGYDVRLPDGHHKVTLLPPRLISEGEVVEATVWFCQELERAILKAPTQWWWLHDRWKVARKLGCRKDT